MIANVSEISTIWYLQLIQALRVSFALFDNYLGAISAGRVASSLKKTR